MVSHGVLPIVFYDRYQHAIAIHVDGISEHATPQERSETALLTKDPDGLNTIDDGVGVDVSGNVGVGVGVDVYVGLAVGSSDGVAVTLVVCVRVDLGVVVVRRTLSEPAPR